MEKAWSIIGMIAVIALIATTTYLISGPKKIIGYSLKGNYQGIPAINVSIDNSPDETITLSKEVTWSEAVRMVDSLNAGLKKNSIK